MSGTVLLGMVGMLVLPLLLVAGLLAYATVSSAERTGLHRGALQARWGGVTIAVVLSSMILALSINGTWPGGRLGVGALSAATILIGATVLVLAILLGELTIPVRSATQRYGLLAPRDARSLICAPALVNTGIAVAALIGYAVFTTAVAAPDDQRRPGRALARTGVDGTSAGSYGPFPGQWYTIPLLAALALLLLATAGALVVVIRRRPSSDPHDLLVRRRSVTALLGAVAAGAGLTAQALAMYGMLGFLRIAQPEYVEKSLGIAGTVISVVVAILGLLTAILGAVMMCAPAVVARRIPARGAAAPTEEA